MVNHGFSDDWLLSESDGCSGPLNFWGASLFFLCAQVAVSSTSLPETVGEHWLWFAVFRDYGRYVFEHYLHFLNFFLAEIMYQCRENHQGPEIAHQLAAVSLYRPGQLTTAWDSFNHVLIGCWRSHTAMSPFGNGWNWPAMEHPLCFKSCLRCDIWEREPDFHCLHFLG